MVGHHKDTAELVKQRFKLRASHVLIVHNLFQVVMSPEIVQQPERQRKKCLALGFHCVVSRQLSQQRNRTFTALPASLTVRHLGYLPKTFIL